MDLNVHAKMVTLGEDFMPVKLMSDLWTNNRVDPAKYRRWNKLVNMTPNELERFMNNYGQTAGLSRSEASAQGIRSGRDSARAIIRMKNKRVDQWNSNDEEWMNRQISFISRMRGMPGQLYDNKGQPTRKLLALKVWGHNPEK